MEDDSAGALVVADDTLSKSAQSSLQQTSTIHLNVTAEGIEPEVLRTQLLAAAEAGANLVLNLSEVASINAAEFQVIVAAAKTGSIVTGAFQLESVSESIAASLQIAGARTLLAPPNERPL